MGATSSRNGLPKTGDVRLEAMGQLGQAMGPLARKRTAHTRHVQIEIGPAAPQSRPPLESRNTQERPVRPPLRKSHCLYFGSSPSALASSSQPDARLRLDFPICLFAVFSLLCAATPDPPSGSDGVQPSRIPRASNSTLNRRRRLPTAWLTLTSRSALTRTWERKLPPGPPPSASSQAAPGQAESGLVHRLLRPDCPVIIAAAS